MFFNPFFDYEVLRNLLGNDYYASSKRSVSNPSNIYSSEQGYMIQFLAPGVKSENIEIEVNDGMLNVKIHDVKKDLDQNDKIIRSERVCGEITKSYSLPNDIDFNSIQAKAENGVIGIFVPKKQKEEPKKIQIKVN